MNNFVNFLLDYYVWILIILGVIIITIIGFLVDSKQKRKKNTGMQENGLNEVKTVEPMPDNQVQSVGSDVNTDVLHNSVNEVDNTLNLNDEINTQQSQVAMEEQPQTIKENVQNVSNSLEQPNISLSRQVPNFPTKEVLMPVRNLTSVDNDKIVAPQPVNAVPINNPVQYVSSQQSVNPNVQMPYQNYNNIQTNIPVNSNVNYNNVQSNIPVNNGLNYNNVQQPLYNISNNLPSQNNNNFSYNNIQNVNAYPNGSYRNIAQKNNSMPIQSQANQDVSDQLQNQYSVNNEVPITSVSNGGINFVTGVASENPENDSWKL